MCEDKQSARKFPAVSRQACAESCPAVPSVRESVEELTPPPTAALARSPGAGDDRGSLCKPCPGGGFRRDSAAESGGGQNVGQFACVKLQLVQQGNGPLFRVQLHCESSRSIGRIGYEIPRQAVGDVVLALQKFDRPGIPFRRFFFHAHDFGSVKTGIDSIAETFQQGVAEKSVQLIGFLLRGVVAPQLCGGDGRTVPVNSEKRVHVSRKHDCVSRFRTGGV